jgi:hypothetical protein
MPDDMGTGLLVPVPGKDPGRLELGPPSDGLPPLGRPWAKANALKAKMNNQPRRRSLRMTHPSVCSGQYMPFVERKRHFVVVLQRFYKSIVEVGTALR